MNIYTDYEGATLVIEKISLLTFYNYDWNEFVIFDKLIEKHFLKNPWYLWSHD